MACQIIVALTAEGSTDIRFLEKVVQQAFEYVALTECNKEVEVICQTLVTTKVGKDGFPDYVKKACEEAINYGASTVAIHSDADKNPIEDRKRYNFIPAQELLNSLSDELVCKLVTPVIPVKMIEAWMLADKNIFKNEIGSSLSDADLEIDGDPEKMDNPKEKISNALRIAKEKSSHKRRIKDLEICDMYQIMGQMLEPKQLSNLSSYRAFLDDIKNTFRILGYLH